MEVIIKRLKNDEVVNLETSKELNQLLDYMIDHNIDPNDYRISRKSVWMA